MLPLDILPSGNIWDTDPADLGAPIPFTPQGGTDLLTGLNTVNGNPWPNALITGGVPGSQGLTDLTFNDFNATETFTWLIDADPIGIPGGAVFGSDLIGSNIIVDFSNGATLSGGLFAVMGDPTASQFLVTGGSIGSAGLSGNALDGLHIEQVNSNIASFTADDSAFNDNGLSGTGSGINFAVMTGSDIGPVVVSGSDLSGNATDGFRLVNVAPTSNLFDLTFDANQSISGNGGRGINLTMPNGVNVNLALTNNAGISANTLEGVLVDMGENATLNMLNVFGNTFGNTGNGNGGPGLRVDANLGSTVNLNLGDSTQAANTFTGNGSAGAAITLNSTAVGNVTVENTTIAGTTGGGAFGGDGLAIRLTGNAQMPNLVIGDAGAANTSFSGNAGDGIGIQLNGFSQLTNPTVQNIRSTGNTGDGLNVLRQGSGVIDNFLITDSTFTGNQDGIHLQSEFALLTDEYTLTNNTFNNNTLRGAFINAQADARISLAVTNNTFDNNGSDGMQIVTVAVSPGDAAEVFSSAAWDLNSFSNNGTTAGAGGAGLELSGNGVFNLVIGVLNPNPLVFSNVFNDNAGDGIEINGPGSLTLIDAQVAGNNTAGSANGLAGIDINSVGGNAITVVLSDITGNLGDGVEIDNVAGSGSTFTFFDTFITFNGRDGIEYVDQGSGTLTVTGTSPLNSVIADNGTSGTGGRGIDIVAGGSTITNSTVIINNTGILRNRQEGVNVILTADAAQGNAANRDALSSAALANNGAITSTPFLNFTMTNSIVNNNGQVAGNIGGSGLVMRVGTTRGGDGIASNGAAGGFASAANGGVNATVTGNTLMGNFGADVVFESFVSIANSGNVPAAGNWTDQNENPRNFANDVFDPTGYQSDPIARLDLMFSNNTGEELDVTRIGAFYNDNDPNWKSRGITGVSNDTPADGGADDNGVFSSGARHRNAQRLAARNVDFLFNAGQKIDPQLTIGASDNFLFAGLGQSSFRVNNQTTANNNFGLGIGFLIDNFAGDPFGNPAIYDSILEANGVFNPVGPNTSIFDRMPYGWSLLP
jgi:trimeric autotransporter adhesin